MRSRAESGLRWFAKNRDARRQVDHVARREGDEMACRCGARWPVGEEHP